MDFNNIYDKTLLPKYGSPRNQIQDNKLIASNLDKHIYAIQDRLDLVNIKSYSIDPDGCEDADDAFSIYDEDGKLYLAIHIADPTHYIQLNSPLWKNILERTVTRYPSNHSPFHMMPKEIVDKSSLMENQYGPYKNAISVITEISPETGHPINGVRICYTKIFIPKSHNLSYDRASVEALHHTETGDLLSAGLLISHALKKKRNTLGKKINNHLNSTIQYINDQPIFIKDTLMKKSIKGMIAEFAIFANSIVGKYLTYHLNGLGIFRTCDSKEWLDTLDKDISGEDLMNKIIDNGISADYQSKALSHDLVGSEEYCHFTSPIRRVSDCVCHYLLKYIYLSSPPHRRKLEFPFSKKELDSISNRCQSLTKYMRKIQFRDTKLRTIQAISNISKSSSVKISVRFVSYSGLFINFIINKIITDNEEHMVSISYVLRIKNYQFISYWKLNPENTIHITEINILGKFDENTLPELDSFIKNPFVYTEGDIYDKYINRKVILHNWNGQIQKNIRIIRNDKDQKGLICVNANEKGKLSNDEHILKYNLIGPNGAVTKIELDQ
jgi:exoribonuclease R